MLGNLKQRQLQKKTIKYKKISFKTKLQETNTEYFTNDTYHLNWQGKDYLLGDGAKNIDLDTDKQKLQHKLAVYIACSKLLKEDDEINLVVLSPMSIFSNKKQREEFREYILDDSIIKFKLFDKDKTLIIKDVKIFAETGGIVFSNPQRYKNRVVGVIDIGGVNINGCVYNNLSPIKGTEFTINEGSYLIMNKIRKELNKEFKTNIQEYQIPDIINKGYYNYNPEKSKEIIMSILSDHNNEIIHNMKANNWDVKGLNIVLSGGGSLLLGETTKKYLPQAEFSDNPEWDNALGGLRVGEMLYGI